MGGAEGVVDVDVGVDGERLGELRVVLLLLGVEAEVLEQDHLAGLEPRDGVLGADAERVAGHGHGPAEQLPTAARATGRRRRPSLTLPLAGRGGSSG